MKMWICRDMDNTLWLSEGEPYLEEEKGEWNFRSGNYMILSTEKFPEVTFENSPMEVELVKRSKMKWIKFTEQLPPKHKEVVIAMRNKNMCEYGIWLYDICFYLGGDINDNNNWEGKVNWEHPIYWSFIECPE